MMPYSPPAKRQKMMENSANVKKEVLNVNSAVNSNGINNNVVDLDESLYSRQIYVMGTDAMKSMSNSSVLISGLSGLGVEIAKNVILAGVKSVALLDNESVCENDLSSQYYFNVSDIGKCRAKTCLNHLVELNSYVDVRIVIENLSEEILSQYNVVVITNESYYNIVKISNFCHTNNVKLIVARTVGLSGMIFCDMGPNHLIIDTTGEEPQSVMIQKVHNDVDGLVVCLEETRHGFQDGDWVTFSEVGGMESLNNSVPRFITVEGPASFRVGDLSLFPSHTSGGICTQVKMPKTETYLSFDEAYKCPEFVISDFAKYDRGPQLHTLFLALDLFTNFHNRRPCPLKDHTQFLKLVKDAEISLALEVDIKLTEMFLCTLNGIIAPMCAVIGGIAAQEVLKACTNKFNPIKQFFYFDAYECLPENNCSDLEQIVSKEVVVDVSLSNSTFGENQASNVDDNLIGTNMAEVSVIDNSSILSDVSNGVVDDIIKRDTRNYDYSVSGRYSGQVAIFGNEFQKRLADYRVFVVGSGAIGCELLKNLAMMGVGTSDGCGSVKVTDMDRIEKSNLNRQFLFKNSDINQLKSFIAAKSVRKMNPQLNIEALDLKVCSETESYFNDNFFDGIDVVVNALDNVEARQYVDRVCVFYERPLLESGTLGTKANVQVIIPHLTESYSSSQDPPEKTIPVCTLKNFPYLIEHTIQWSRDLFEGVFSQPSTSANQFLLNSQKFIESVHKSQSVENIEHVINIFNNIPKSFSDCVAWSKIMWQQQFYINIKQLLHNFPSHSVTTQGLPFWSGTKRCPKPLEFNINNPNHFNFVVSAAKIRASMFDIDCMIDNQALKYMIENSQVPNFVPKADVKIAVTDTEAKQMAEANVDHRKVETLIKKLELIDKNTAVVNMVEFEKDCDSNFHIDFITSASNMRAENYNIEPVDRLRTKMIAGKIIPAIATTTSMVAGLVSLELYKIVQGHKNLEKYKNGFINLALPFFGFSEPIAPVVNKYYDKSFTLWDRFELKHPMTLQQFIDYFKNEHNLTVTMVSEGVSLLYAFFQSTEVKERRQHMLMTDVVEQITKRAIADHVRSLVLEISCQDDDENEMDTPYVKYDLCRAHTSQ